MRRPRIRRFGAVALTAALILLAGCATEPAGSSGSAASSGPSPTSEPTTPSPPTPAELRHADAVERVTSATTREKVASIVMSTAPGTDPAALRSLIEAQGLGGVILMGSNVPATPDELRALTGVIAGDPGFPALIGIDQEGGVVSRLAWDDLPSASALRSEAPDATEAAFAARARLLADTGVSVNFGIVADITADPSSFLADRVLGVTPDDAADRVAAAVRGERGVVRSTLKHFPGHGSAPGNSHEMIPQSPLDRAAWKTTEAVPFRAGINAGAELMMTGHVRFPTIDPLPASLSPEWHRIAREDLGFTGVIVTDDLVMLQNSGEPALLDATQNAIQALLAGNDLLLHLDGAAVPAMIDGLIAAVDSGAVPEARLVDAATRVAELRLEIAGAHEPGSAPAAVVGPG